jgi:hypothetical protein
VVAVNIGASMPTRQYSQAILAGLWPTTSADTWSDVAATLRQKSDADADTSSSIRRTADGLYPDNSGHMVDGMYGMYMRDAIAVMDQSDLYQSMSSVVDEVAQLIYHARTQLDEIDRTANEKIEKLKADAGRGGVGADLRLSALVGEIAAIISAARGAAAALSASVAGEIASQAARIGASGNHSGTESGSTEPPYGSNGTQMMQADYRESRGAGGQPLSGGMAVKRVPPPLDSQPELPPKTDETQLGMNPPPDNGPPKPGTPKTDPTAVKNGPEPTPRTQGVQLGIEGFRDPNQPPLAVPGAPSPTPPSSSPAFPMTGGSSGGLNFPSTGMPSSGMSTSTPSAGSLGSGLASPASGLTSPPTSAAPNDFSLGLNAGLGGNSGGAPLLPPPVSSPPPAQLAWTAGATSGPPPVLPAAGPSPPAAPLSASAPPPISGAVMPPAAAAGPLPPFTSDLPRNAPPVTPASGPALAPSPPPAAPPPAASPPVAPLPPGVVGSGVGAAAAGAGIGVRSSAPDPLLEGASRLVYELMHASRLYAAIDWCVGVFKTPSGPQTVVVSSEGAGYIPPGVFLPRSVRLLFSDPGLSDAFRARWFAWVNPAQTMLAFAATFTELDPNIELYAVAVSTDHGGSALPARDAGVPHYEDCSLLVSPIPADAPAPNLDANRMHRLEALDRAEYARLTRTPDRSESWTTTETAVRVALSRASALLGFSVPPAIRQISQVLGNGEAVTDEQWSDLELVRVNAILDSASQRPGRMLDSVGASPYARAYHNLARLAELLALWRGNDPQHAEIAYTAAQITTEARLWPAGTE